MRVYVREVAEDALTGGGCKSSHFVGGEAAFTGVRVCLRSPPRTHTLTYTFSHRHHVGTSLSLPCRSGRSGGVVRAGVEARCVRRWNGRGVRQLPPHPYHHHHPSRR